MNKVLLPIRLVFILLCTASGWLVCYTIHEWDALRGVAAVVGLCIGALVILVDLLLKGFSLRGLSAVTFGLAVGSGIAYLIGTSPLFDQGDPEIIFLVRLTLYLVCSYLATVIALRGKDEFNLVIPYVRFVPHDVDVPVIVVDTSVLVDGRIGRLCECGFMSAAIVIPRFVITELQRIADSGDALRQARGRRGLEVLAALRGIRNLDIRIQESEVAKRQDMDAKLVFLAQSMRGKLMTTDYNLAKLAEFHGVPTLNIHQLGRALQPELMVGEKVEVELVRPGKEEGQAVGYLADGSMVVVGDARSSVGHRVQAEIVSILPTGAGKMVFAKMETPENALD